MLVRVSYCIYISLYITTQVYKFLIYTWYTCRISIIYSIHTQLIKHHNNMTLTIDVVDAKTKDHSTPSNNLILEPTIDEIPKELLVGNDYINASRNDSEFVKFSWSRLVEIIGQNQLQLLGRLPSDLRKYLVWKSKIIKQYGSVVNFMFQDRLHWGPEKELAVPKGINLFEYRSDYKILMNDFPYGFEDGIIHIVVWTKIMIPKLADAADLTEIAREQLQRFVECTFQDPLEMLPKDILWFKNWAALMSIREIDHFHVLLNRPPIDSRLIEILDHDDVDVDLKLAQVDSRARALLC
ncbi:uncharacterized protein V1516DRAFT_671123 [Lipomyces oligophaga]|uniref:uncharacterized protein n=1 Tax=Lipomyces oligophaga TaxID=45792 RepID=UPI0034CEC086